MPEQIPLSDSFVAATGARLLEIPRQQSPQGIETSPPLDQPFASDAQEYPLRNPELFRVATESYIFGYPLVLMDLTRRWMTNVSRVCSAGAPINQFLHGSHFDDIFPSDLSQNNPDMICSSAWIDLSEEPLILSLPEMGKRYHMLEMLDAWTNVFASIGTRNIGSAKTYFAITGPNWRGSLPLGLRQIKAPTNLALLIGRVQIKDRADCSVVRKLQTHYKLAPLSAWDKTYFPPDTLPVDRALDMTTPPATQIGKMDAMEFFLRMMELMKRNPAPQSDNDIKSKLAMLGLTCTGDLPPGHNSRDLDVIHAGVERARALLESAAKTPAIMMVNGWGFSTNTGRFGADYMRRAAACKAGIGTNILEDAICFRTVLDSDGHKLDGKYAYILHFPPKKSPPVKAFWSLTARGEEEASENPAPPSSIGTRDSLVLNADGSLDIYIHHEFPHGMAQVNWLRTPPTELGLILRLYWPKNDVWEGRWVLPAVHLAREKAARAA